MERWRLEANGNWENGRKGGGKGRLRIFLLGIMQFFKGKYEMYICFLLVLAIYALF
jgi:hypothetical protein